jgi:adenylate kinase
MRLILFGPPGSGKGTQAKLLSRRLRLEHIGTGDILRDAMRRETPTGRLAKPFVEAGQLVPDDVVNAVVAERFRAADRPERFVMDGYPRTLAQGKMFDAVLREVGLNLTAVVLLDVSDEEIIARVSGRWSCPKSGCKATYHVVSNPPKTAGVCDECGTPLVQRADDQPETVRERLRVYHKNSAALIPYYRDLGLLHEVAGQGGVEDIYANIVQALGLQAG